MFGDTAYVVEWGAISLPFGHPSRVTSMEVHPTFAEAAAAAEACEFDARVFPIAVPDPRDEPGFTHLAGVTAVSRDRWEPCSKHGLRLCSQCASGVAQRVAGAQEGGNSDV